MQELDEKTFDNAVANGVTVIDFGAEWCGPCKTMLPVIYRVSNEYDGKMRFYFVDIDKSPDLAARHGVMSVPTLLFFKGGKPVERIIGAVPEREIKKRIDSLLGAN